VSLIKDCWQERFPDTADFCPFNLFTKTEFNQNNFIGDTLQISNLPSWLFRKHVVDLTLLHFVHQTRSVFIAPVFASHLHNMYDQFYITAASHYCLKTFCSYSYILVVHFTAGVLNLFLPFTPCQLPNIKFTPCFLFTH